MSQINSDTLYTKDTNDSIRFWKYQVLGPHYRTVSGKLGGQTVVSKWTEAKPVNIGKSNYRSAEVQALAEAQAKFDKKLKTGYFQSIDDISIWEHYPMLAQSYKDQDPLDFRSGLWLGQCKYNGHRCVATKDGLWTRKRERIVSVPHIEQALIPFFQKHPQAMLDGELFNEDLREKLNELSSICRKTVPTAQDLVRSEQIVRYYPYDGYGFCNTTRDTAYEPRKKLIDMLEGKVKYVCKVPSVVIMSEQQFLEFYQQMLDDHHEGAILRRRFGTYFNDKRVATLLKHKPEDEEEFTITDIEEGTGNWSGVAKRIYLIDDKGNEFKATFKGSFEEALECLQNKQQWIGETVSIKFNGRTGLGTPNFAQFDYSNCQKTLL